MKKVLSVLMSAALLVSAAAVAHADEATIPMYVDGLDIPALQEVPTLYTEFNADKETTTLWSSMPVDGINVNAYVNGGGYNQQVALQLDETGTTATYSNRGMKRQVGIWWAGSGSWDNGMTNLTWWKAVGTMDKNAAIEKVLKDYAEKGWSEADLVVEQITEVTSDMYKFYVDVNGVKTYVGFYNYDAKADEATNKANAQNVINYLVSEGYNPDALSYERVTEEKPTTAWWEDEKGQWHDNGTVYKVFVKNEPGYWYSCSGDDAYYVKAGSQTSVHGRDGSCHMVYAWTQDDLFNSDMKCTGTTVTWAKNGTTHAWYPAEISANYENSFVTNITAKYLPDVDNSLQGYTVKYSDKGVVYSVDYNPYGGMETAKAWDLNGAEFKAAGSSTSFDWVNTATFKFMRNFSLLPLKDLKVTIK
jgi:hypothetical protein